MSGYLKRCVKFTPKCGSGNVLRIVKGARVNILQRRHSRNPKTQSTILSLSLSLIDLRNLRNKNSSELYRAERAEIISDLRKSRGVFSAGTDVLSELSRLLAAGGQGHQVHCCRIEENCGGQVGKGSGEYGKAEGGKRERERGGSGEHEKAKAKEQ